MSKMMEASEIAQSGDLLKSYLDRLEKLTDDIKSIQGDIKEIYSEAKSAGFVPKYLKQLLKLRQMDRDEIQEQDEILKIMRKAVGL